MDKSAQEYPKDDAGHEQITQRKNDLESGSSLFVDLGFAYPVRPFLSDALAVHFLLV